ncbi:MAG: 50S ribosomal protein L4 [Candidatus Anstonellales archaeon]
MKVDVYSVDGKKKGEIESRIFDEDIREDLIRRAALSDYSKEYQPKGAYRYAGMQTSAYYRGEKDVYRSMKNIGGAKLPREIRPGGRYGRVRRVPFAVGGRRAHPPKPQKIIVENINKKEYIKALRSAVAATASSEAVKKRGHIFEKVPIVVDGLEDLKKAKEVIALLEKLGLMSDVERSKERAKKRVGRKGGTKRPKSVLFVVSGDWKAGANLSGSDVVVAGKAKVKDFAPGGVAGRLAVYSSKALSELEARA